MIFTWFSSDFQVQGTTIVTNIRDIHIIPFNLGRTQCVQRLTANVLDRNLVVHNSGIINAVTGPAPNAKVKTYLQGKARNQQSLLTELV